MQRTAAAVCLVLAPIALAISTGVDPALGEDQGYGIYRDNPDAIQWHSLLLHWAWLLFVPGMLGLLNSVRQRGAGLARIAWLAIIFGLTTFSALMFFDLVLLALEQNLPNEDVALVDEAFSGTPWAQFGWQFPGLVGWALALVLTPIAAARARVINWWTAAAALAGTALYFIFAISPVPVNLAGPVLLVGAYASAGWQLTRHRNASPEPDRFGAFRRRAGLACLFAAPVALLLGMASIPGSFVGGTDALEHPGQAMTSAFLLHLAWLLFVPAVLTVAQRGGRLTRIGSTVAVLGLVNMNALLLGDHADLAVRQVLGDGTADAVGATLGGYPLFTLGWALPGMVLTLVGLILVSVGAAHDAVVRWWLPLIVVAGLGAFLTLPIGPLGVVGPLILVGGFGLIARSLTRSTVVDVEGATRAQVDVH